MTFVAITLIFSTVVYLIYQNLNSKVAEIHSGIFLQLRTLTDRVKKLEQQLSGGKVSEVTTEHEIETATAQSRDEAVEVEVETQEVQSPFEPQSEGPQEVTGPAAPPQDFTVYPEDHKPQYNNADIPAARERMAASESDLGQQISQFFKFVVNYFKTGNTVVKVGVIVLFFGVSFLIKFASDKGLLPIELRMASVALAGVALTQLGWKLRLKRPDYCLAVQGGGIGILFITTFASFKLYELIPSPLAFFVLVALAALTGFLAVVQDSRSLAVFGIIGGFLAPILASTGQGQHVILFSYYAILNLGILGIAWHKSWRSLNLIGFIFTFLIGTTWGVLKYNSAHFITVEPFLVLFFLIYAIIPILFAKKQKPELRGFVDGTLVFGNTIIAFGLQTQLVKHFEYGTALSALAVSLFYILLGRWLYSKNDKNLNLLVEAFVALGVVFATITIPLAFDGQWTAAVWAAEAAGIYWVSVRQGRYLGRVFSSFLIFAAGFSFMVSQDRLVSSTHPFLNSYFFGCLMIAFGALVASYVGYKHKEKLFDKEKWLIPAFFVFGSLWWTVGGYVEIHEHWGAWVKHIGDLNIDKSHFPAKYLHHFSMLYMSLALLGSSFLGIKLKWHYLNQYSYFLVVFLLVALGEITNMAEHPFAYGGAFFWVIAFISYYMILRRNEKVDYIKINNFFVRYGHATILWLLTLVGILEFEWQVNQYMGNVEGWGAASSGVILLSVISLVLFQADKIQWPIKKYYKEYLLLGTGPILAVTWLWAFSTNWFVSGDSRPLTYIPILNPLEMVHAIFMVILPIWLFKSRRFITIKDKHMGIILGGTYFFWLNGVLMRAIHHYNGVPFNFDSLFSSPMVQMALSIYWSVIGLSLMVFASKKKYRWLWIAGVSLMAIVVIKLFLIDLSKSETVERIISFISVGSVLLVVGYFSPIPPKKNEK